MKPYYQDDAVTIYHGDCLEVLDDVAANSVGTLVADPPYSSGGRNQASARNIISKTDSRDHDEWFLGDNMGGDTYVRWMRQVGRAAMACCAPGSQAFVFTDWRQYTNLVTAWESVRWMLRSVVVWDKARGGAMGSFWRNNHEWVAVLTKGQPQALAHGSCFNTWAGTKPQGDDHPTVKPEGLIRYLLESVGPPLSSLPVLDPFMGSGTTLRAAKDLGRKAIGIEIEERYCEIAAQRMSQEVLPLETTKPV